MLGVGRGWVMGPPSSAGVTGTTRDVGPIGLPTPGPDRYSVVVARAPVLRDGGRGPLSSVGRAIHS